MVCRSVCIDGLVDRTALLPHYHVVFNGFSLGYDQHSNKKKKLIAARAFCFLPRRMQASRRALVRARTHTYKCAHACISPSFFLIQYESNCCIISNLFYFCFLVWYEMSLSTNDRHLHVCFLHEPSFMGFRSERAAQHCENHWIWVLWCGCSSKRCSYSNDRLLCVQYNQCFSTSISPKYSISEEMCDCDVWQIWA